MEINKEIYAQHLMAEKRNILIMVTGLPGSGKSYFARRLASEIDALYLSTDEIRRQVGLRGKYQVGDKLRVYEELLNRTISGIHHQQSVILDATFYLESVREQVYTLAEKLSCKLIIIHVFADEKLIIERLSKERKDSEADFQVYLKIKNEYEPLHKEYLELESTNDNISTMLEKSLTYISTYHEKTGN